MTVRSPKSVLVTGGCGFIGSNFISLISIRWPDAKIINLDKLLPGSNACNIDFDIRNATERYQLVIGDCCNRDLVMKLLQENEVRECFRKILLLTILLYRLAETIHLCPIKIRYYLGQAEMITK